MLVDSWEFFRQFQDETTADDECASKAGSDSAYDGDAGQHFALRLKKAIQGYRQSLDDNADIVVMGLDSATPGRMAILFYRELHGSDFLARLEHWHSSLAWPQNLGDIAVAAYGRRIDDQLRKRTQERLLPCIIDGRPIPQDLVTAVVSRTKNRVALDSWEFERNLGIACSLYKAANPKENYPMNLDESRRTRDYLYGCLLAIADDIESLALRVARQDRETSAARLMQRFADHPFTTWRTLELQLRPYIAQLRSSRAAALAIRLRLIDLVVNSFETRDGQNTFLDNHPLSGEFLLGYHSQREALRPRSQSNNPSETTEGDAE
jgi:CRISPR-associated protein Csd1